MRGPCARAHRRDAATRGPAPIEIELIPEAAPERVLVATLRLQSAAATSLRALALEARADDVTIAASRDAKGILPATVEADGACAIVRLGRAPVPPLEIALRIRAAGPSPATIARDRCSCGSTREGRELRALNGYPRFSARFHRS